MKRLSIFVGLSLALVGVVLLASLATAQRHTPLKAKLSGFQEVPAVSTPASGEFLANINRSETEVEFALRYQNLQAATLFAHIHFSAKGVNGGVMAFLCGGGGKPACTSNVGENLATGSIVAADVIGPNGQGIAPGEFAEFVRALRSGASYANVHSTLFPGGEIRGQISVVGVDE